MKLYDIVFSPTCGTKKVADYLVGALEVEVKTVDLADRKQYFNAVSLANEDVAVISVPSYGAGFPRWRQSSWAGCTTTAPGPCWSVFTATPAWYPNPPRSA